MSKHGYYFRISVVCLWIFIALGISPAIAESPLNGKISAEHCRIRLIPSKVPRAAGYMTLHNHGPRDSVLVSISTDKAEKVEVHRTSMEGGMAKMRRLEELVIPSKGSVEMVSGGIHLMFKKISPGLKFGDTATLSLHFKNGENVAIKAKVVSIFQDMEMSLEHKH